MHIVSATLCDFATVREGLLTVVSAGVTRSFRPEMPSGLGVMLALHVAVEPSERLFPHEIEVLVVGPASQQVAQVTGALQLNDQSAFDADEDALVPVVIDLRTATVNDWGWVTVSISADGGSALDLRVKLTRQAPLGLQAAPAAQGSPRPH